MTRRQECCGAEPGERLAVVGHLHVFLGRSARLLRRDAIRRWRTVHAPVRINGKWGKGATAALSPNYINISAFSNSAAYTFGNLARTAAYGLRGPVNFDMDMSLKKTFPIHERINALIDVSAYNVTNLVIFDAPPANTGTSSTFGKVTSQANNSRNIQFAFRLNF
jgi:hypothetical protein